MNEVDEQRTGTGCTKTRKRGAIAAALVVVVLVAGCSSGGSGSDGASPGTTAGATSSAPLVRKDAKDLTAEEKADLVAAFLKLKELPPPATDAGTTAVTTPDGAAVTNWYDYFVATHAQKLVCSPDDPDQGGFGHSGPDILTWHRAFLLDFEAALGTAAGKPIALPYWDWTDPDSTAAVFSADLMGPSGSPSDGYAVMEGAFRKGNWVVNVKPTAAKDPRELDYVVRALNTSPATPPSIADWNTALAIPTYDVAPYNDGADVTQSFRNFANGAIGATGSACVNGQYAAVGIQGGRMHDQGHGYVAGMLPDGTSGTMHDTATSPNDPSFWLHHANVDRLAENWWRLHDYQFLPVTGGLRGDNIGDALWPYDSTSGEMATSTESLGYVYDQPEAEMSPQGSTGTLSAPAPSSHGAH